MIQHIIHFRNKDFNYTWEINLPYRIIKGDFIHYELLTEIANLQYNKEVDGEFYDLELEFHDSFFAEVVVIDHNLHIVAYLNTHKKSKKK